MENKLKIIGGALAIIAACLGLVKTYGYLWGGIASVSTIIIILILLNSFVKDDKKQTDYGQRIGDGAKAQKNIEFESIEQKYDPQTDNNIEQSVGKDATAGEGISFKDIRQH